METQTQPEMLRVVTAAKRRGVTVEAIYRLIRDNLILSQDVDGIRYVNWSEVESYHFRNYPRRKAEAQNV